MKYEVTGTVKLELTIEVEAESPEAARDLADQLLTKQVESGEVRTGSGDAVTDLRVFDMAGNELLDHDDAEPPSDDDF
jgi:hypothetical protein